jgi:DNA-binding PadR family transcriptional regulator
VDAVASREQSWSPLKYALLCLLLQKPAHGYELANLLARRLGGDYVVNRRTIYRMLEAFEREGLAVSNRCDEDNPDRIVYTATPAAEAVVARWMSSATGDGLDQQMRELQAKLTVARMQDLPALLTAINEYERRTFAIQQELERNLSPRCSSTGGPLHIAREEELGRVKARLESLGRVRGRVRELMTRTDGQR